MKQKLFDGVNETRKIILLYFLHDIQDGFVKKNLGNKLCNEIIIMGFEAERSKRNTLDCLMSERYFEPSAIDGYFEKPNKGETG